MSKQTYNGFMLPAAEFGHPMDLWGVAGRGNPAVAEWFTDESKAAKLADMLNIAFRTGQLSPITE